MAPRSPLWPISDICWRCEWNLSRRRLASRAPNPRSNGLNAPRTRRPFHATRFRSLPEASAAQASPEVLDPAILDTSRPIRDRLKLWQETVGSLPRDPDNSRTLHNTTWYQTLVSETFNNVSKVRSDQSPDESDPRHRDGEDSFSGLDDLVTLAVFLKPGDVVEIIRHHTEQILAVFVQHVVNDCHFVSVNGRPFIETLSHVHFVIRGVVDPALLTPLIPFFPTEERGSLADVGKPIPRELSSPLMDRLESLQKESEKIYRENATALDNAHYVLAGQSRLSVMKADVIARMLLKPNDPSWTPDHASLLAVRKALFRDGYRFSRHRGSQRLTNEFAIRPKDDVEIVEMVHQWVREYEEHRAACQSGRGNGKVEKGYQTTAGALYVARFIEKARRLVAISRKYRDSFTASPGPTKRYSPYTGEDVGLSIRWGEAFDKTDQQILYFMQSFALTGQFRDMEGLVSACATILRGVGCYDDLKTYFPDAGETSAFAGRAMGTLFLQEIGVVAPHDKVYLYDEHLMLPTVRLTRNMEALNRKAELIRNSPDFRDSMEGMRTDWGSLPVYCIDDADAKEIDDALSVTKVQGSPGQHWIHVHVANPTAFFSRHHILAGMAAHSTESLYVPERTFPMLPSWATQNYFSLGPNRPVLTFSTRVDSSGNVLERKIQSGIVRNVVRLTYNDLYEIYGEAPPQIIQFSVGGTGHTSKRQPPELTPAQLQDLKELYNVAKSAFNRRKLAVGFKIGNAFESGTARVFERPGKSGISWMPPSTDRARFVLGDPIIEYSNELSGGIVEEVFSSNSIVMEMMLLACATAGAWCNERNIPAMYRGTIVSPTAAMDLPLLKEHILRTYYEKHGQVSRPLAALFLQSQGRSIVQSAPLPHKALGFDSYLKVTSPLRRFTDMVSHWQIEAALRYEHNSGRKYQWSNFDEVLPFTRSNIQDSLVRLVTREKMIQNTKVQANHAWTLEAFIRAYYYKEAQLPPTFRVWVGAHYNNFAYAQAGLIDYGVRAKLLIRPGFEYQYGDEWEAKIVSVNSIGQDLFLEPVRLLQRDDETPKWVHERVASMS